MVLMKDFSSSFRLIIDCVNVLVLIKMLHFFTDKILKNVFRTQGAWRIFQELSIVKIVKTMASI